MAEPQIVNTLRTKRDELERIISSYETTAARRDLAHENATLELFERHGAAGAYPSRLSIARMFKRGEIFELCKIALSVSPQCLDTRELALYVIHAKGLMLYHNYERKVIGWAMNHDWPRSKRSLRARRGQQGPQVQLGQLVHKDRGFLEGGAGASAPATSARTSAVTAAAGGGVLDFSQASNSALIAAIAA